MPHKPIGVERKRSRGWKMPPNTVCVTRGTPWGNIFIVNPHVKPGSKSGCSYFCVPTVEDAVACFAEYVELLPNFKAAIKEHLAGKNLACFCKLGTPCHRNVLLKVANE